MMLNTESLKQEIDTSKNERIEIQEMEEFLKSEENIKRLGETIDSTISPELLQEFEYALKDLCENFLNLDELNDNQGKILNYFLDKFGDNYPEMEEKLGGLCEKIINKHNVNDISTNQYRILSYCIKHGESENKNEKVYKKVGIFIKKLYDNYQKELKKYREGKGEKPRGTVAQFLEEMGKEETNKINQSIEKRKKEMEKEMDTFIQQQKKEQERLEKLLNKRKNDKPKIETILQKEGELSEEDKEKLVYFRDFYYKEGHILYKNFGINENLSDTLTNELGGKGITFGIVGYDKIANDIDKRLSTGILSTIENIINQQKLPKNIEGLKIVNEWINKYGKNNSKETQALLGLLNNEINQIITQKYTRGNINNENLNSREIGIFQLYANTNYDENLKITGNRGRLPFGNDKNQEITNLYIYRLQIINRKSKEYSHIENITNLDGLLNEINNKDKRNEIFKEFLERFYLPIKTDPYGPTIENMLIATLKENGEGLPFRKILIRLINQYNFEENNRELPQWLKNELPEGKEINTYADYYKRLLNAQEKELTKLRKKIDNIEKNRIEEMKRQEIIKDANEKIKQIEGFTDELIERYNRNLLNNSTVTSSLKMFSKKQFNNILYIIDKLPDIPELEGYSIPEIKKGIVKLMHLFFSQNEILEYFKEEISAIAQNIQDTTFKEYSQYNHQIDLLSQIENSKEGRKLSNKSFGGFLRENLLDKQNLPQFRNPYIMVEISIPGCTTNSGGMLYFKTKDIGKISDLMNKANNGEIKLCIDIERYGQIYGYDTKHPIGIENFAIANCDDKNYYTLEYEGEIHMSSKLDKDKIKNAENDSLNTILADESYRKNMKDLSKLQYYFKKINNLVSKMEDNDFSDTDYEKTLKLSEGLKNTRDTLKENNALGQMSNQLKSIKNKGLNSNSDSYINNAIENLEQLKDLIYGDTIDKFYDYLHDSNTVYSNDKLTERVRHWIKNSGIATLAAIAGGVLAAITFVPSGGISAGIYSGVLTTLRAADVMTLGGIIGNQIGNTANNGLILLYGDSEITLSDKTTTKTHYSTNYGMERDLGNGIANIVKGDFSGAIDNFGNYGNILGEQWFNGTLTTAAFMGAGQFLGKGFQLWRGKHPESRCIKALENAFPKKFKLSDKYSEDIFNSIGESTKKSTFWNKFWHETGEESRQEGTENITDEVGNATNIPLLGGALTLRHSISSPSGNLPNVYKKNKVTFNGVEEDNNVITMTLTYDGNFNELKEYLEKQQHFEYNKTDGTFKKPNDINNEYTNIIKLVETKQPLETRNLVSNLSSYGITMDPKDGKIYYSDMNSIERLKENWLKTDEGIIDINQDGIVTITTGETTLIVEQRHTSGEPQHVNINEDTEISVLTNIETIQNSYEIKSSPEIDQISQILGLRFHEERRESILQTGGSRVETVTDPEWIAQHNGQTEVDIANTYFEDLPSKRKNENLEAAKVALGLVYDKVKNGEEITPEMIEEMAEIVHNKRLERNGTEGSFENQRVPYNQLSESEKTKDRDQILQAIETVKGNNQTDYFDGKPHQFEVTETQARGNSKMMGNLLNEINEQNKSEKLNELRNEINEQYKQATGEELNLTDEQLLSILDAHEQDGKLGELTMGQLRQKVKILDETITEPNVRRFLLEAGFCGQRKIQNNKTNGRSSEPDGSMDNNNIFQPEKTISNSAKMKLYSICNEDISLENCGLTEDQINQVFNNFEKIKKITGKNKIGKEDLVRFAKINESDLNNLIQSKEKIDNLTGLNEYEIEDIEYLIKINENSLDNLLNIKNKYGYGPVLPKCLEQLQYFTESDFIKIKEITGKEDPRGTIEWWLISYNKIELINNKLFKLTDKHGVNYIVAINKYGEIFLENKGNKTFIFHAGMRVPPEKINDSSSRMQAQALAGRAFFDLANVIPEGYKITETDSLSGDSFPLFLREYQRDFSTEYIVRATGKNIFLNSQGEMTPESRRIKDKHVKGRPDNIFEAATQADAQEVADAINNLIKDRGQALNEGQTITELAEAKPVYCEETGYWRVEIPQIEMVKQHNNGVELAQELNKCETYEELTNVLSKNLSIEYHFRDGTLTGQQLLDRCRLYREGKLVAPDEDPRRYFPAEFINPTKWRAAEGAPNWRNTTRKSNIHKLLDS